MIQFDLKSFLKAHYIANLVVLSFFYWDWVLLLNLVKLVYNNFPFKWIPVPVNYIFSQVSQVFLKALKFHNFHYQFPLAIAIKNSNTLIHYHLLLLDYYILYSIVSRVPYNCSVLFSCFTILYLDHFIFICINFPFICILLKVSHKFLYKNWFHLFICY